MKRRFVGEADGRLLDRRNRPLGAVTIRDDGMVLDGEGQALGRATSITIDDTGLDLVLPPHTPPSPIGGGLLSGEVSSDPNLPLSLLPSSVDEVGFHYMKVMKPRWTQLPPDERKIITEALKIASVDELKRAIDGCAASPFHMGQNTKRKKYNSLSQIMTAKRESQYGPRKTARERIDSFLDLAEKTTHVAGSSSVPSDDPAKLTPDQEDRLDEDVHAIQWMFEHPIGVNLTGGEQALIRLQRYGLEIELDESRTRVVRISTATVEDPRLARLQPLIEQRVRQRFGF